MANRSDTGDDCRGSSYDRHSRKLFLLAKFGDGEKAPCWDCGKMVSYTTIHVDRITPGIHGGRYTRDNIRPHCKACSDKQGNEVKASMGLFKSDTEQDVWIESNCQVRKCFRYPNCPILARGIARGRKPREWDRNTRATQMKDVYSCNAYGSNAPRPKREKDFEDVPMFDELPVGDKIFVPVDDWPDRPIKHSKKMTTLDDARRLDRLEKIVAALRTHQHLSGEPTVLATISPVSPPMYLTADRVHLTRNDTESLGYATGLRS